MPFLADCRFFSLYLCGKKEKMYKSNFFSSYEWGLSLAFASVVLLTSGFDNLASNFSTALRFDVNEIRWAAATVWPHSFQEKGEKGDCGLFDRI